MSVIKVVELVGQSTEGWEEAVSEAVRGGCQAPSGTSVG